MVSYKASLFLLAIIITTVTAEYHYERFKALNFHGVDSFEKPWFFDGFASPYKQDSPSHVSSFSSSYDDDAPHSPQSAPLIESPELESPLESYFTAGTKKIPIEDKSFKKAVSPFYTITDQDPEKYKKLVLKAGVPYCQEIKSKAPQKRFRRDAMTCYKCKDPRNGASYEQCSYTSEPQESVQVEDYVPLPSTFRYRRSSGSIEKPQRPESSKTGKKQYRFGEDIFVPEASDKTAVVDKNCDKVVKDSMICMVCKDPKTNGKYEQCSYTTQPKEKAYAYTKSSSYGNKPAQEQESAAPGDKKDHNSHENTEQSNPKSSYEAPAPSAAGSGEKFDAAYPEVEKYFAYQKDAVNREPQYESSGSESVKSGNCKKVNKESMTCMVCLDPKTGGEYEQCSYAHEPKDKLYQFSKSKSFGYPDFGAEKSTDEGNAEDGSQPAKYSQSSSYEIPSYITDSSSGPTYPEYTSQGSESYYQPQSSQPAESQKDGNAAKENNGYYQQPSEQQKTQAYTGESSYFDPSERVKSESEKISENIKASDDCHKVEKSGMTCTVCKDHKNGGNFEQCSYAYDPKDKVFSFSKSKAYGSPANEGENPKESHQQTGYGDAGSYGFATENKPYLASENQQSEAPAVPADDASASKEQEDVKLGSDFLDTFEKKAQLQKVFQEFAKEDRSKCKQVIRDKMTCYQCTDENGVQKEECMFIAEAQPSNNRLAYREVKEFKLDPTSEQGGKKVEDPLEPAASASERHVRRAEPEEEEHNEEAVEKEAVEKEDVAEEAYDYEAATKPTYDKVLGLTLPAYMLATSEHEAEFDEVVASSRI